MPCSANDALPGAIAALLALALSCERGTRSSADQSPAAGESHAATPPAPLALLGDASPLGHPALDDPTYFLPPSPPADLAASLRAALSRAATTLHTTAFSHTELDAFVLVNADGGAHYAAAVALVRKALPGLYSGRFDRHPTRAVTVFIFTSPSAYDALCRAQSDGGPCPTEFGEYDRAARTILMHATPGAETILHEIAHPLVRESFPRAPTWLDEGIASLFEAPAFCGTDVTGVKNWRYDQLREALDARTSPEPPRLDALFSMDRFAFLTIDPARPKDGPTDPIQENLHYATARYFVQWLDRQGKLWPFYRTWRDAIATDPDGRRSFAATMGRDPGEVQTEWAAYVRSLSLPGSDPPCPDSKKNSSTQTGDARLEGLR